jgi:hypothetical protein
LLRYVPVLSVIGLAACDSQWEIADDFVVDTDIAERPYFHDEDGDGWGDFGSTGQLLPQPDQTSGFTAVNNRDCDDADENVTGITGSICPERLTLGGSAYTGVVYETEFVVVHDDSELVWPGHAEDACGPWGWGGGLAQFADTTELAQVQATLEDFPVYAGWVGVVGDGNNGWQWEDGTALAAPFSLCPGAPGSDEVDPERQRLALLKLGASTWCFGTPDQVEQADWDESQYPNPGYTEGEAYFVCERETPDPEHYALDDVGGEE